MKNLYFINLSGLFVLASGFCVALIVPKVALASMGSEEYGRYAVILGYCMIVSFMDMGLSVGLTRELGVMHVNNKKWEIIALLKKVTFIMFLVGVLLLFLAIILGGRYLDGIRQGETVLVPIAAGCLSIMLVSLTDIYLIAVRVAGGMISANMLKSIYYLIYLFTFFYFSFLDRLKVLDIFTSQIVGSIVYSASAAYFVRLYYPSKKPRNAQDIKIPWKKLMTLGVSDQVGKLSSAFVPGIERNLMLNIGGGGAISAYDISQRLSALVTAIPASLSAPLIALLSPNITVKNHLANRRILKHTNLLTYFILGLSLFISLLFVNKYAEKFYHLEGTEFLKYATIILIANSINVLTATPGSFLLSHGRPFPIALKSVIDVGVTIISVISLVVYNSVLLSVSVKGLGLIIVSLIFLIYYNRVRRNMSGDV